MLIPSSRPANAVVALVAVIIVVAAVIISIVGRADTALALFTFVLAVATMYYAIQTARNVEVGNELLSSNRELIDLSRSQYDIAKAQNDINKAQLLSDIHALAVSTRGEGEASLIEQDLQYVIRMYLNKVAGGMLGDLYNEFVRIKLIRGGTAFPESPLASVTIFNRRLYSHQSVIMPRSLWEKYKALHRHDSGFSDISEYHVQREDLDESVFYEDLEKVEEKTDRDYWYG